MDAMKIGGDLPRAVELFREALRIDPRHEDSLYYLGSCLYQLGDVEAALEQLEQLVLVNPQSHRGHKQKGRVLALSATSRSDMENARRALERALEVNPEETGVPLLLAEVELVLRMETESERRLQWLNRTNPRAVGAYFLRGFLAWDRGDRRAAEQMLAQAREALGPEWTPEGTTSEGDVREKMHTESSPLSEFWLRWDGSPDPELVYPPLASFLASHPARRD
jgi:tetratricopeptide (TPR) repeat protein